MIIGKFYPINPFIEIKSGKCMGKPVKYSAEVGTYANFLSNVFPRHIFKSFNLLNGKKYNFKQI